MSEGGRHRLGRRGLLAAAGAALAGLWAWPRRRTSRPTGGQGARAPEPEGGEGRDKVRWIGHY